MQNRKSPRLKDYDYTSVGMYFVTICAHERAFLFGEVVDGVIRLNRMGHIVAACWAEIPAHFTGVGIDGYVIMPNHVHGIIEIQPPPVDEKPSHGDAQSPIVDKDATCCVPTNEASRPHVEVGSLGAIVRSYKSAVTRQIRQASQQPDFIVWQGRYHDHIIRNEADLNRIREYVLNNPARWQEDRYYAT